MNRIVLIGNGFDLAHDLKTKYEDFIYWYWKNRILNLYQESSNISDDHLCKLTILQDSSWNIFVFHNSISLKSSEGKDIYKFLMENKDYFIIDFSPFFGRIHKSIETKGWVDIEYEYYSLLTKYALSDNSIEELKSLNEQLHYLKDLLVQYLGFVDKQKVSMIDAIKKKIYASMRLDDISVSGRNVVKEIVDLWMKEDDLLIRGKMARYGLKEVNYIDIIREYRDNYNAGKALFSDVPRPYMLPDAVMLLNFNYTHTAQLYYDDELGFINYIHGKVDDSKSVIFGYGDELDDNFKNLKEHDDGECQRNVKSIKYLESDNYRKVLTFIESAPYQVYIMGHSCGKSDRTLLNTLFEHRNCISIKPYYYIKDDGTDNYLELVQNISRNFTDMKLMRDRVVNKIYCETLL